MIERWVAFWDRREAPHSLALVRILVGLVLLWDFLGIAFTGLVPELWLFPPGGLASLPEGGALPLVLGWFGASDLAYMMALYWFPPVRRQREQELLHVYHEQLMAYGVTGYAWADLWDDYRLAVLRQFFEAVWGWSTKGQGSLIWWNHLERISLAIAELDCLTLL